jgi:HEAT repeat protein
MRRRAAAAGVVVMMLVGTAARAQDTVTFEQMVQDLGSEQAGVRRIAAAALKQSAYPEAAVPLARAITDPDDTVQLEAIAGELNIYLAEKIVPRRRVGFVVEVRNRISGESVFTAGPAAVEPRAVPVEVVTALRTASRDDNPRVAVEAMYAFGVLASELGGRARQEMLIASAPEIAAAVGVPDASLRTAAVRVIGRVYGFREGDAAVPETVGDAVVGALNDRSAAVRAVAMDALGAMRYVRGVQALTELVQHHQRGATAASALEALAHIGHPSSEPLFVEGLASRDGGMRRASVEGLARLRGEGGAARINGAMTTERDEAVLLAGHFATVLLADGPIDQLIEGLTRSRLREQAYFYLLEIAPGRARAFNVHIQDPDERVRLDLVDILALSGDEQAIGVVERLLHDQDPTVSRAAGRAIVRLRAAAGATP